MGQNELVMGVNGALMGGLFGKGGGGTEGDHQVDESALAGGND